MASFRPVGAWWRCAFLVGVSIGSGLPVRAADGPASARPDLTGWVVDAEGSPLVGAAVCVTVESAVESPDVDENSGLIPLTTTRPDGSFQIAWTDGVRGSGLVTLWAVHPGWRLARHPLAIAGAVGAIAPVRLTLTPEAGEARARIRIVGPGGEPVAAARVRPSSCFTDDAPDPEQAVAVPYPLADRLSATTDREGWATLPGLPATRWAGVNVAADLSWQATAWDRDDARRARVVRLRGVGAIAGRVRVEPGENRACDRWPVRAITREGGRVVGATHGQTDQEGQFQLAGVVAGSVEVQVTPPSTTTQVASRKVRLDLEPNQTASVELPVQHGLEVTGTVVERGAGAPPIAGVNLLVAGRRGPARRVRTDEAGHFAAVVGDEPVVIRVEATPNPFLVPLAPDHEGRTRSTPEGANPGSRVIALDRGVLLAGRVATPTGALPTEAHLVVQARWLDRHETGRSVRPRLDHALVDPDGTFTVGPFPVGASITLGATRRFDGPAGPTITVVARPDAAGVHLAPPHPESSCRLTGSVVDQSGRPVAGALVQFRWAEATGKTVSETPSQGRRITSSGLDAVVTDPQGEFHAVVRLDDPHAVEGRWSATAEAGNDSAAVSPSAPGELRPGRPAAGEPREWHFGAIVLRRDGIAGGVAGRVIGSAAEPVAGVVVRDLAGNRATTDAAGLFRLEPAPGGVIGPVLVAERAGYRVAGVGIGPDADRNGPPLTMNLTRHDEPTPEPTRGVDHEPRRDQLPTLEASVALVLARRDPVAVASLLEQLANTAPARVAVLLRAGAVADPRVADGLRLAVVEHLATPDPTGADAVAAAIEAPDVRGRAHLLIVAARNQPAEAKRERIERVERDARSLPDLASRAVVLAAVAEAWLDLDQPDRARQTLHDAGEIADALPRATSGGTAWCALIAPLARLDPAQAQARLDRMIDPQAADRCRLALARQLADHDPATAVRFFRQVRDRRLALGAIAELGHRIAPRDLPLARSLIEPIQDRHPIEAAHALGMMAHALAPTDRPAARLLLRAAFARLADLARSGTPGSGSPPAAEPAHVAALLLLAVEAVDPALVPEFLWLTVSLHNPAPPVGDHAPSAPARSAAILATLLHRYDPATARLLFDPRNLDPADIPAADFAPLLQAAARLAPEVATRWVATHPRTASHSQHLVTLIVALARPRAAQPAHDARQLLHLWSPAPH